MGIAIIDLNYTSQTLLFVPVKITTPNIRMMNKVICIGSQFPDFEKSALLSLEPAREYGVFSSRGVRDQGLWMVMFWWPRAFSEVCPSEAGAFNHYSEAFAQRGAALVGASTEHGHTHWAWARSHLGEEGLGMPMVSDDDRSLAARLGILAQPGRWAYRATFIVDPTGTTRWVQVNDLSVCRKVGEVLRVLDTLQAGERRVPQATAPRAKRSNQI